MKTSKNTKNKKRAPRFVRLAAASLAFAGATAGLATQPKAAHAWKPKTHIYLAEQALKDALDNGKVTIYETDYQTGKITGVLGEFDVDPKILAALRAAPAQYRAGVMGPDAYPDIMTGQQIIHPDEAQSINDLAGGTNSWLTHIWNQAMNGNQSPQVQAFAVGYLTHAAGDVFAHTYVNYYTGGEFQLLPDPTNAVKHLILEGYIGKRTPQTLSATPNTIKVGIINMTQPIGAPITENNTSISGVESFLYNEMTYAKPGSLLEQKLMIGSGTKLSIPAIFSAKRNALQRNVEEYDRIRLSKTGPARLSYALANGPAAEYQRNWVADIDAGLKAWPTTCHEVAKALVYNENGADLPRAKAAMMLYLREHLASMIFFPDAAVAVVAFVGDLMNAIIPQPVRDAIDEIKKDAIAWMSKNLTGKTPEEWADYLKNPDTHFNRIINTGGGGHDGDVEHPIDLATFNREQLKISDTGFTNPNLKWEINQLPPAFNTVQMCKLLLLGKTGTQQLANALHAKNADMGAIPGSFQNLMLGWVRSLDHGNQWQGFESQHGGVSPRPLFAQNNGAAYQKMFLPQVGEKSWLPHAATPVQPGPPHGASPVVNQDLSAWEGNWDTSFGPITLKQTSPGVVTGLCMNRMDFQTFREGQKVELTAGSALGKVQGTWRTEGGYADSGPMEWTLTNGGTAFEGNFRYKNNPSYPPVVWNGVRIATNPATPAPPPGIPTNPTTGTPTIPTIPTPNTPTNGNTGIVPPPSGLNGVPVTSLPANPAPSTSAYAPSTEYKGLTEFDVKLDNVALGRTGNIEVSLSMKNIDKRSNRVAGGYFDLWMFDSDGVGWQAMGNVYRASGSVPEAVGTLNVARGEEVKVRYIFRNPGGLRGLMKLRMQDRSQFEKAPITFDLNNLMLGSADKNGGALPSGITPVADNAFKDLDDWDVRLDGVKKRQAKLEVYFTVKNTTAKPQRFSAVRMTASDVDSVSGSEASTLYRASGATREPFTEAVDVDPGGEMRVCFIVSLPSANVALKKLTGEVNGGGSQTWDISGVR